MATKQTADQQRKRNRIMVWGIGGGVILIGSVALVSICALLTVGLNNFFSGLSNFGGEGGLTEVEVLPDRFMLYMDYGDTERAYGLLSSYGQENFSEEDLADLYTQYELIFTEYERFGVILPQSSPARSLADPSQSFDNFIEVLAYEIDTTVFYDDGRAANLRMIVGPEGGRWLIDTVEITP